MYSYLDKKEKLEEMIRDAVKQGVCIAFSGGVDSSVLVAAACREQRRSGGTVFSVLFDTFLHSKGD